MILSRVLFGAAALLWIVAAFLPSTSAGSGATLSGYRFADLMTSGTLSIGAPAWLGTVWYAMPLGAAFTLMALGLNGRWGPLGRIGAASIGAASALAFGGIVSKLDVSRLGSGLWCAVAGSACAVSASVLEMTLVRRGGSADVL